MSSPLAAVPAVGFFVASVVMFLVAWNKRGTHPATTHRLVIALMTVAFGVNSLVASLALLGYIKEQETITFVAAMTRTIAIFCAVFITWHW
jgi:hypothetical protein